MPENPQTPARLFFSHINRLGGVGEAASFFRLLFFLPLLYLRRRYKLFRNRTFGATARATLSGDNLFLAATEIPLASRKESRPQQSSLPPATRRDCEHALTHETPYIYLYKLFTTSRGGKLITCPLSSANVTYAQKEGTAQMYIRVVTRKVASKS